MVFALKDRKVTAFNSRQDNALVAGPSIQSIAGHYLEGDTNILDLPLGTLLINQNMEYRVSNNKIFLLTRRGSTLTKDIVLAVLGAGQFSTTTIQTHVWVDNTGILKYLDTNNDIQTIATGLDVTKEYETFMYGHPSTPKLYFCQEVGGIFSVDSSYAKASVLTDGVTSFAYSNISRRLFAAYGHKVYYSNQQAATAADTTNLETFNTGDSGDWLLISPDEGVGIKRVIDDGEITYFFKDTGIWALINAEEADTNWLVPKCNADQGTLSPKTVVFGRYGQIEGFIYLATDKTLRFFNASVIRNSGAKPTLSGGDSVVISEPFDKLLKDIPDGQLSKCSGSFFDRYYFLNIVSSNETEVDTLIIVDTEKLVEKTLKDDIAQPFWFEVLNWNFTHYVIEQKKKIFGYHRSGYLSKLLIENQYYDETPARITTYSDDVFIDEDGEVTAVEADAVKKRIAIRWKAYMAWYKFSDKELLFYDGYINWRVEGKWNMNFKMNSFEMGRSIPAIEEGLEATLKPDNSGNAFFDRDFFDLAYFSSGGQLSQNVGLEGRGHYFSFGMYNENIYEWATFYGIETRFQVTRNISMGTNI